MGFLDEWSLLLGLFLVHALGYKLLDFLTIVLVEGHIVITYQVITFLTRRFRCLTIAPLLPSQHGLTDMDTTVVDDIGLNNPIAIGLHNLCQRPA